MTLADDHKTYANGLTLVRLRVAQNSFRVRELSADFKALEDRVANATSHEDFVQCVHAWSKKMEFVLRGRS